MHAIMEEDISMKTCTYYAMLAQESNSKKEGIVITETKIRRTNRVNYWDIIWESQSYIGSSDHIIHDRPCFLDPPGSMSTLSWNDRDLGNP